MEINGNDPGVKKSLYTEKKEPKQKIGAKINADEKKGGKALLNQSNADIKELQATVHKSIRRSQAIIGGLENLKTLADSTDDNQEKKRILEEILSKTVIDNNQVLNEYKNLLITAITTTEGGSLPVIDQLLQAENENMKNYSSQEQNIISIGSSLQINDPESLLKSVIRQLKEKGEPKLNLPIQKVLDLLEE